MFSKLIDRIHKKSGRLTFEAPAIAGTYEFHYHIHCFDIIMHSNLVTVLDTEPKTTIVFTASPSAINIGQHSTLKWNTREATECIASGGWNGKKALAGSETVCPSKTTTYTLSAAGPSGNVSESVTVVVGIFTLRATPSQVKPGERITVTWSAPKEKTSSKDRIGLIRKGAGYKDYLASQYTDGSTSGNLTFNAPTATGRYNFLYLVNDGYFAVAKSKSVKVLDSPSLVFTASTLVISPGESTTLSWNTEEATECIASGGWNGKKALAGSETVCPSKTTTYTLTAAGPSGNVSKSVTVVVGVFTLRATPSQVKPGERITVTWSAPKEKTSSKDWIALFRQGDPNKRAWACLYTSINFTKWKDYIKDLIYHFKCYPILKKLIKNQKILIIGSGPSAGELEQIPEGVRSFTCNRGLKLFLDKKFNRKVDLYLCYETLFNEYPYIVDIFSLMKIKILAFNDLNYISKNKKLKGVYTRLKFDSCVGNYYLKRLIKPYTVKQIRGEGIPSWTSMGMRLLQYALYFGAKEIYLIGIDLGLGTYFWGQDKKHFFHNEIDGNFIKIVSKKYNNIYSLSKNSPITIYIPYKTFN